MRAEDKELIQLSKQGNRDAFQKLMEKYSPQIYNLSYRLTKNETDAKDIFQETFIKAFKSVKQFKEKSEFSTWLYRIAVNLWINETKKPERRKILSLNGTTEEGDNGMFAQFADTNPLPGEELEKKQLQEIVQSQIAKLNPEQRLVIVLRYIENKSYVEIAEICKCNIGTVGSRICRASDELRRGLRNFMDELK